MRMQFQDQLLQHLVSFLCIGNQVLCNRRCMLPIVLPRAVVCRVKRFVPVDHFGNRTSEDSKYLALSLPIDSWIEVSPFDAAVAKPIRQPLVGFTAELY